MSRQLKYETGRQRAEAVARWRSSGLSQAAFCRQEGISQWALSSWKRDVEYSVADMKKAERVRRRPRRQQSPWDSESDWAAVMAEHAVSGLSMVQFCQVKGISINTFRKQRAKLTRRRSGNGVKVSEPPISPFVEVKLDGSRTSPEPFLDVFLPGGSKIRVTDRTPLELLSRVLKTLEERC